jgi:general secretion pathway protein G
MRKASFTMIELVFVIVILGILASVAIPKLAATRDDASTATITSQVKDGTKELISFYTAAGGDVNFSKLNETSQITFNELIRKGWVEIINDNTCYLYDDKTHKKCCLIYTTNGRQIEIEYNNSNSSTMCQDIKRIIKERNYSILNTMVNF